MILTLFCTGITILVSFLLYMSYKLDVINKEGTEQITFLKLIYEEIKRKR